MKKYLMIFILILPVTLISGCNESRQKGISQTDISQANISSNATNTDQKGYENSKILTFNNKSYDLNLELSISLEDKLTKEDLGFLRNGIFAKYGYKFKSKLYSEYFSKIAWYKPSKDNVDELLNEVDRKNIQLILKLEAGFNLRNNEQDKIIGDNESSKLTSEEIANFEKELGDKSNCGFLTCEYSDPSKIDLNEVFYTGCGLSTDISEIEKKDLIKNFGFSEDGFMLDYIKIKTPDINNLLLKKVGLTLTEIEKKLTYKYVSKYDAYYSFHGDTNYIDLKCISGNVTSDGVYIIKYIAYVHSSMPINRIVTFKKVNDRIVFISNSKAI